MGGDHAVPTVSREMCGTELTVAVTNYNGRDVLGPTLDALRKVECDELTVLLVDDGSTDGSPEWVREHYPEVRVIAQERNTGKPSSGRNRALAEARTPYVLLLDNDVAVRPDCPARLMAVMRTRAKVFGCSPRLLYSDDPQRIYYDGSALHYLCVSAGIVRDADVASRPPGNPVPTITGGNVLVNRELAHELGYFDERYAFGWGEDAELCVRARLAGYECLHVPDAVALHAERPRGTRRAEAQFFNRYRMLATMYAGRTLLVLAPALLTFELGMIVLGIIKRLTGCQMCALARIVRIRAELRRTRAEIQGSRIVSDLHLLEDSGITPSGVLARSTLVSVGARVASGICLLYWRIARRLL